MRNPLCLARTLWRSIRCRAWVMGHDYVISDEPTPKNVQVLECETCGHFSVAWSWGDMTTHLCGDRK